MQRRKCPEYAQLETEVSRVLQKLTELTSEQLEVFRAGDLSAFMRLDKELETTVGLKERSIGSLRQHARDHKCCPNASLEN